MERAAVVEVGVVAVWIVCVVLIQTASAALARHHGLSEFTARKIPHVAVGLLIIPLVMWVGRWQVAVIPVAMILGANARANRKRARLPAKVARIYPVVAVALPAVAILFLWARRRTDLVVLGVLAMTMGDTAAAFVGRRFGRRRVPWTGKSVEGAAANAVTTWIALTLAGATLYRLPASTFWIPAIAAATVELLLPGEWDNPIGILVVIGLLWLSTA